MNTAAASALPDDIDLANPELYFNRELSQLEFNARVLEQAKDESVPLLERMRFLCISCTNLDEFFEIRVGGLHEMIEVGSSQRTVDGLSAAENLAAITTIARDLVAEQYRVFNEILVPELAAEAIRFIPRRDWSPAQYRWLHRLFRESVLPVLTPIGLDPAHPFPRIINKSLNFIVDLDGTDAFGRPAGLAVVQAPRSLPRLTRILQDVPETGPDDFVFLSSIIHEFVGELFPGMDVLGCHQFRVTRNSDLFVDDEEVDDLKRALEGELAARRYGDGVRLEVARGCPEELIRHLLRQFELTDRDLYEVDGPVNLNRLSAVVDLADRPDLKFAPFVPGYPRELASGAGIMGAMRRGDVLLHHPYQSFTPVIELLEEAAADPDVLAIKQTLYRTGPESPVVDGLVAAARSGKEVTVVVELRARFDEEANIELSNRLQAAGAHVVYGVVGYKTHAKMLMVVRREPDGLRRYVHLGTGNYHPKTARLYTDYGLLTCREDIGRDVHDVFMQITSPGHVPSLKKLLISPFTLHDAMIGKIRAEAEIAARGGNGRIVAKMNSLVEPEIIRALYEASQAGVSVDLIVRGVCCLRPGVQGISDNIRVRSIIGRFLEHPRVFVFQADGQPEVWASSADWMDRNFFYRVETCFPVEDATLKQRIIDDLELNLWDNSQAWTLGPRGEFARLSPESDLPVACQSVLLENLTES
jgi:polyphosphate kinase